MAQLISIQERGELTDATGGWQAVVRFNNGPLNPITITNPFSGEEEKELEWYFEEHLEFPFTQKVRAQKAVGSIASYGEKLFSQVFEHNAKVLVAYRNAVQAGLNDVQIEIEGSPKLHALHWEALKDPELPDPLVLQATMVRKNLVASTIQSQVRAAPTVNLLVVTARPSGKRDVGYRTISRPLVEALRQTSIPIQIEILRPGTYKALENHLRDVTARQGEGYYHVIHFDVHGSVLTYEQLQKGRQANRIVYSQRYGREDMQAYEGVKAFLAFESEQEDGKSDLVEASELAALLLKHHVPITILNACQSGKQIGERETSLGSQLMQAGVQLVLAMGYSVTVSAAELMMRTLYQKLFENDDLKVAIRHARTELYNHKERRAYFDQNIDLEDWLLPVVCQNQPVQLQPRQFTPEERSAYNKRKLAEKQYAPPEPQYGFVGRDLDILQIEKRLLAKRNILLIRGMGGAGKTTLLKHLRAWWHTTGFVQQTFYFGYDEKAWKLQQILMEIAQQLYGPQYYTDIQPYPLDEQQLMIAERLRAEPHLLILDNLESITGTNLAIQNTLPKNEQDALRSFLADLAKGKTRVLLGSRSGEDWLSKGTFDDNIYNLPGLDDQAASTLAERILERNGATKYREDDDLRHLLKLLDGFPLALEVVLPNLARQAPKEVLTALQAGDVNLDIGDPEDKTKSILRCIDYSHSNLSPEAQQLLLCLAPFTSVFWLNENVVKNYIDELRRQPALTKLPFERWTEVTREAQNWGLLSPDPDIPQFLRMQPVLCYFLRNRLSEPGQEESKSAIETAFREHYRQVGQLIDSLLISKNPQERQVGQLLASLEYENLVTGLNLVLVAHESITGFHDILLEYLNHLQNQRMALELFQNIEEHFAAYPPDKLAGSLGVEYASVIGTIANWQSDLKQYKEAEQSYRKVLEVVEKLDRVDTKTKGRLIGTTYNQLGIVAQEQRRWAQAEQYYQQALQIYVEYNDRYPQANTYQNLGVLAQRQHQWEQAKQYYLQALQIKVDYKDRYAQADTYHQLGRVAQEQQQWQQAKQYYQQALQIYVEYNARHAQADTYYNLGVVAQEEQQWIRAEQYYQQALQIYVEYNDRYKQAGIYHNLGTVAQEQRQWEQAEQYYQQALQIYVEYNDHYEQARNYHRLGRIAQEQRQWIQARDYLLRALEMWIAFEDTYSARIALRNLARLWKDSEDKDLPELIAEKLDVTRSEVEKLLRELLGEGKSSEEK